MRLYLLAAWWVSVGVAWANYDEFMTCGSGSERYGRHYHHFPELPCDLNKDSWCESPGNQYPWSAVRRFVYENQGLMKRMYGNQRHYSVLRAELLNDLYDEMFDEMIKRPHHRQQPSSSRSARYQKPSHPAANSPLDKDHKRPHGNSRAMKVTIQPQYSSVRRQHAAPRPKSQGKPQRKAAGTSRLPKGAKAQSSSSSTTSSTSSTASTSSTSPTSTTKRASTTTTTTSTSTITTSDVQPTTTTTSTADDVLTTTTFWGDAEGDLGTASSPFEEETQATLLPPDDEWTWATTLMDPTATDPSGTFPTAYDGEEEEEEEGESSYSSFTVPETSSPAPPTTQHDLSTAKNNANKDNKDTVDDDAFFHEDFISTPLDEDDLTTLTLGDRLEDGTDYTKDEIDLGIEQVLSEEEKLTGERKKEVEEEVEVKDQDSQHLKAENREHVVMDELRVDGNVREEVKVEETATKEGYQIKKPVRGMNACPVEEEFVAPYWANNTRGETLALLNQYPFEQYIQWERCKYEHRQMYCRRGCRCEQQYRLHRLLAFDPTNECRGIFSDWFRFPSFCVCKCYDLPLHVFTGSQRMGRFNEDGSDGDEDEEYDDYYDDEEEEDYDLEEEEEEEEGIRPEPYPKQGRVNIEEEEEEEEAKEEEEEERNNPYYYSHRARPSSPLANIPPQRRPRPPPRPYSHISPPSHTLEAPSRLFTPPSPPQLPPTPPTETTTLGTVDAATPHYYFNLTNYARVFLAKGQPLGLSRVPRSPEE
ncbi:protein spaetzle 4-like isoform X2 [Eriocheir sinensis]|uniref:protein spaetzle 4-like isoform X2 n=1 Tax=Eriocheir sinensis TaxID=95602 RepID=UPI0021CAC8DF|nr:protein spaetzle 4-like isoform X2 [Eriocheir sinensis]XP_050696107.1 protein spaetzle 4-like isoform X2 [Eriocheir sinensis]XP_050696108.1 protein spaetzle 4-like isoform X2 [Eriocheir sinensis]